MKRIVTCIAIAFALSAILGLSWALIDAGTIIHDLREDIAIYEEALQEYDTMAIPMENIRVAIADMITTWTSNSEGESNDLSDVFMDVWASKDVRHKNLMPYVLAIAIKESGCVVTATHPVSSASGIGQVIYRYHEYLKSHGILKKDLTSDPYKSILSIYLVLERYWLANDYSYKEAVYAYRGRRYEAYYRDIVDIVAMFGCKLFK